MRTISLGVKMAKTELEVRVDTAVVNGEVHPHAIRCLSAAREGKAGIHMYDYQRHKYCTGEQYCPMSEDRGRGFPYCLRQQYARDVADRNHLIDREPHKP